MSKVKKENKNTVMFGNVVLKAGKPLDLVIAFDTTGSMLPCLQQLREKLSDFAKDLWDKIPNLKVGVVCFGDYCDEVSVGAIQCQGAMCKTDLTKDRAVIDNAVRNAIGTGGGDMPEMYERVLHEVQEFSWRKNSNKIFIMLGDDLPHDANYAKTYGKQGYDWQLEARKLAVKGVQITAIRCLKNEYAEPFWKTLAEIGNGTYMKLTQFADFTGIVETIGLTAMHSTFGIRGSGAYMTEKIKEGKGSVSLCSNFASATKGLGSADSHTGVVNISSSCEGEPNK